MQRDPTDVILEEWASSARNDAIMARWRTDWEALDRYLSDDHTADTLDAARRAYKLSSVQWSEESAWVYLPLVQMFADRLSVTFDLAPSTYLVRRGSKDPLPETDPQVQQWRADEETLNLPVVMQDLERRTTALRSVACHVTWMRDHVEWQLYAPSDVITLPSSALPGDIQQARAVGFRVRQGQTYDGTPRPDVWLCHTLERDATSTRRGLWLVDDAGRRLSPALMTDGSSPYQTLPVVVWSWDAPRRGSIWPPPPASLLAAQRQVNLSETDLHHGLKFSAHPARIRFGQSIAPAGGKASTVAVGPGFEDHFQDAQTGDLQFRTPTLNTPEQRNAIESLLKKLAVMHGLPPDTFSPSAVRTMGALQEMRAELERIRDRRRPVVQRLLAATFAAHRDVANAWADWAAALRDRGIATVDRIRYDGDVELRMEFVERRGVEDRQAAAQALPMELEAGLTSDVEQEMAQSGGTRLEAEATLRRRRAAAPAA